VVVCVCLCVCVCVFMNDFLHRSLLFTKVCLADSEVAFHIAAARLQHTDRVEIVYYSPVLVLAVRRLNKQKNRTS